jgi:hypothetical protein
MQMLNLVLERKRSMKSTIIAIIFLIMISGLVASGCASECPGFFRVEEEGYIRCSVENPDADEADWESKKCSVVARDDEDYPVNEEGDRIINGYPIDEDGDHIIGASGIPARAEKPTCCVYGANLSQRECMETQACIDRLAKIPSKTNIMECDENSDCELLYGVESEPEDRKVICCAAWKDNVTECRLPEDCVYDAENFYTNCLATWQCIPPQECIKNVYIEDLYYCKAPEDI